MDDQVKALFLDAVSYLDQAGSAQRFAILRSRFASREQWLVEGPAIKAKAQSCFLKAKLIIMSNKDDFDKIVASKPDWLHSDILSSYLAALKVFEKETEESFEKFILEVNDEEKE